ncbi:hypothetical protein EIP91_012258 [Steccherinum ochraceum]|uniref:C2H2-type domain-containing protein n=1 Tax=Steccherinum ochraceum TaxID=92696 RepID=A0A4R0RGZ2_9APHY|nr:hypothetical protein EIP91_012258 [Steccherinum ochraceum]
MPPSRTKKNVRSYREESPDEDSLGHPPRNRICDRCGKVFKRTGDLKRHIRTHDAPEDRPWACDHCDKKFVQRTALNTHMNIHTGERPFVCGMIGCDAVFSDPSSRSRHRREAHFNHPSFKCPLSSCKSVIKRRSAFRKHLRDKHRLRPTEGEIDEMVWAKEEVQEDPAFLAPRMTRNPVAHSTTLGLLSFSPTPSRSPTPRPAGSSSSSSSSSASLSPMEMLSPYPRHHSALTPDLLSPCSSNSGSPSPTPSITTPYVAPSNLQRDMSPAGMNPHVMDSDGFADSYDLLNSHATDDIPEIKVDDRFVDSILDFGPSDDMYDSAVIGWSSEEPSFFSGTDGSDPFSIAPSSSPLDAIDDQFIHNTAFGGDDFPKAADSASMQGLYYDTIPHSFETAWLQSL